MNQTTDFDRLVRSWLEAAGPAQPEARVVDTALATARETVQRHGLRAFLFGPSAWPVRGRSMWSLSPTVRAMIVAALIGAGIVGVLWVGSQYRTQPTLVPPRSYRGELVAAPDLSSPRAYSVLAALRDGRVLILGGNTGTVTTTAEVYDPATGTSQPTGNLISADYLWISAAAVLESGKVLVVGDARPAEAPFFAVTQLFDPATMQFEPTGPMVVPRASPSLTVLADGRVLMVGGSTPTDPNSYVLEIEIFDPRTGAFAAAGEVLTSRLQPSLARLTDGRVLIVDGVYGQFGSDMPAEIYDPATALSKSAGAWTSFYSTGAIAIPLADGRAAAFIVGLEQGGGGGIWSPETNEFEEMREPVLEATTAAWLDGDRVLLVGPEGRDASWAGIFDPRTEQITRIEAPRAWSPATVRLLDGRVLLVGGIEDGNIRNTGGGQLAPAVPYVEIFE